MTDLSFRTGKTRNSELAGELLAETDLEQDVPGDGVAQTRSNEQRVAIGRIAQDLYGNLQQAVCRDVTFAITAFERPEHLTRLVKSIRGLYPSARIIVGDNGRQKASLPPDVTVHHLRFDCGLSATRNFLVSRCDTRFFLLLEEDFRFTAETRIEMLLEVLKHDAEVGVVGGALYRNGIKQEYAVDFHRFRNALHLQPSNGAIRATPNGVVYQLCDMCFNFALFRKAMLDDHLWPDHLKLGEHFPYFQAVKAAERWRVANCDAVRAEHDTGGRTDDYCSYRVRARTMYWSHLAASGITRLKSHPDTEVRTRWREEPDKPNVIVLGVGHSGTSILSKLLFSLGWQGGDADTEYGESVEVRDLNEKLIHTGKFCSDAAQRALERREPWVIKDPRFFGTLPRWISAFAKLRRPPVLLWLQRNSQAVAASYVRRGEMTEDQALANVENRLLYARYHFERWPWEKVAVRYEDLKTAVKLFAPNDEQSSLRRCTCFADNAKA